MRQHSGNARQQPGYPPPPPVDGASAASGAQAAVGGGDLEGVLLAGGEGGALVVAAKLGSGRHAGRADVDAIACPAHAPQDSSEAEGQHSL